MSLNDVVSVTVRLWVYCAVTRSSNTVSVPSVTVSESLVQVTLVGGPPVEIQVRVNCVLVPSDSTVICILSNMVRFPEEDSRKCTHHRNQVNKYVPS